MARPIWKPSREMVERANITRFMRRHRIRTLRDLHRRSTGDIAWFWDAVSKDLGIEWFAPYRKTLDDSKGAPWAKWFVGGKLNVTHNCVDRHARGPRRNKVAIAWEGEEGAVRKWTYRDLDAEVSRVANGLLELGVRKGDRVGIQMPFVPEVVAAIFATAKIGAVYIPIFSGFGASAAAARLADAGAKVLFTADGFPRRGKPVALKPVADEAAAQAGVEKVVVLRRAGLDAPRTPRDVDYREMVSRQKSRCAARPMDSEAPFLIIHTSGTTGKPKGAVHVHGGFLVKIASEVAYAFDLKDPDVLFWLTDPGWIMAPWELVGALALGGSVLLYDGAPDFPDPDRLWRLAESHGATIFGISPTAIRALMGRSDPALHDLSSLRLLGSTGEPWNPEPYKWYFERVGGRRCPVINISGGTEVGACFLSPLPVQPLVPCSLGGPAPGMDVEVFDENGRPVRNETGELVCRLPWPGMTRGLWKDPERYIETYWSRWPGVWVHGDWARIEDGQWFLLGRSDDTLKVAGKRVGPAEVESVLVEHPAVAEAAAIGVPHEVKGQAIVCFAIPRPGQPVPDGGALAEHVASRLGKALKPERVHVVAALPKTRNAKIVRRVLQRVYTGQPPGDLSTLENPDVLEEIGRLGGG